MSSPPRPGRAPQRATLVQLAHALGARNPWFCNKENVPLAAGYMRAVARSRGLTQTCEVSILEPALSDIAGDAAVVDALVDREVDVLGLSLYPWNTTRSLRIAAMAKALRPGMVVLGGGPEVNTTTVGELLGGRQLDVAVLGEGEITFSELLAAWLEDRDLAAVPGIAFLRDGAVEQTPRRDTLVDLDEIPSPYLEGDIDPRHYRQVHVLFERGCPYSCKFCHWWPDKRSKGKFSLTRIEDELRLLRRANVEEVIFLDASLNASRRFDGLCEVLEQVNGDGQLNIKVQVLFDRLERSQVERLAKGGVRKLELGLQSASAATLKQNQRPTELALFQHALDLTKSVAIGLQIDFIMGLPGDRIADIEETARYIGRVGRENSLNQVSPFVLSVGSATQLRREAESHRLRFQPEPPYRVLASGDLNYDDLRSVRMRIPELLGFPEHPFFAFDRPHYAVNLFEPELATFSSPDPARPVAGRARPLVDVADRVDGLRLRCTDTDLGHTHPFDARPLARRLNQVAEVWLDLDQPAACITHATDMIATLSEPNPHTVWDLVIETRGEFDLHLVDKLLGAFRRDTHNLDWDNYFANPREGDGHARIALRPFMIVPLRSASRPWLDEAARRFPLVYALTVTAEETVKPLLAEVETLPGEGVLVELAPDAEPMAIQILVSRLAASDRFRVRGFRNQSIKAFVAHETARRQRQPKPRIPYHDRTVVAVARDGRYEVNHFTHRATVLDMTELCLGLRAGSRPSARLGGT